MRFNHMELTFARGTLTEGFRAALTSEHHMHLYVIYPVLIGFCALFLLQGIRGFKRRVLT